MWNLLIGPLANLAGDALKRVLPAEKMSEGDRAKLEADLQLEIMRVEDNQLQTRMSAILAEAKSSDPWTSRARPSFLYVFYIMILISIPIGILSAFKPDMAVAIAEGMQSWLAAIPGELYAVFGAGYLGYTGAREYGKSQILKAKR